uniref:CDV3 homolog n=1 Tax=Leptobrachium leishanense TaxID=445787 RepID=A0A8C5PL83_9ANUR
MHHPKYMHGGVLYLSTRDRVLKQETAGLCPPPLVRYGWSVPGCGQLFRPLLRLSLSERDRCVSHGRINTACLVSMAEPEERSLDDFFAKRDKKKKKDKAGAAAAAGSRGSPRPPEGSQSSASSVSSGSGPSKLSRKDKYGKSEGQDNQLEKEDDEWKEFEQKEVDYTGLRIQSLQISNEREEDDDRKEEQGADWDDTIGYSSEKSSGPWNKSASAQAPVNIVEEAPEPVQSGGVYRPPGARASAATRKPQGPPEIFSDTQFPSLQSTAKHIESRRDKEMEKTFEIVKHKNRAREEELEQKKISNSFKLFFSPLYI